MNAIERADMGIRGNPFSTRMSMLLLAVSMATAAGGTCVAQTVRDEASTVPSSGEVSDATTAQAAPEPVFDITELRVLGNSVLSATDIERALYEYVGREGTIKDVERAREKLEKTYRDRGYGTVFVDVPEQDVNDGIVRLRVTEGRLDRVRISGGRYFANGQIRQSTPALHPGQVLSLPALQEQLAKVNRQSRDRVVTPVLRAGRTPGTVDVELKVKDELPAHANVEINDRYTADTSKTRASVNLSYDNLFQRFHSLSLQYQTAPEEPKEARVWAATYVAPLGRQGDVLAVYAVDTDSEVATIGTLAVLGKGRIYGARYIKPLPEMPGYFHNITFGGDFKDFKENVLLEDDLGLQTPIQYVNWSAAYTGNVRTDHTLTSFNIGTNFGIRGLGNDEEEFENKRFKARPNYFYIRANASHERPLLRSTSLSLRAAGQYAVDPVISNEQFSIGGADSVRGYMESEELGDLGISGSLELRSPQITQWWPQQLQQLYLYAFYDAGVVGILDPLPVDGVKTSRLYLYSSGVGLRLAGFGGLEAGIDWAYPLHSTDHVGRGDTRLHFHVRYGF